MELYSSKKQKKKKDWFLSYIHLRQGGEDKE